MYSGGRLGKDDTYKSRLVSEDSRVDKNITIKEEITMKTGDVTVMISPTRVIPVKQNICHLKFTFGTGELCSSMHSSWNCFQNERCTLMK